jgi:hypothetical protein
VTSQRRHYQQSIGSGQSLAQSQFDEWLGLFVLLAGPLDMNYTSFE